MIADITLESGNGCLVLRMRRVSESGQRPEAIGGVFHECQNDADAASVLRSMADTLDSEGC